MNPEKAGFSTGMTRFSGAAAASPLSVRSGVAAPPEVSMPPIERRDFARGRMLQEPVEQELHAEVVHAASEEDGRLFCPRARRLRSNGVPGDFEHLQLVFERLVEV
jgi:hypothetical protein